MIGEVPKLFDRDFAIAYFLPAVVFAGCTYYLLIAFEILNRLGLPLLKFSNDSFVRDITISGLLSLLAAIMLLILNNFVTRLLQGYLPLNYYLSFIQKWRYRRLLNKERKSNQQKEECGGNLPDNLQLKRSKIRLDRVNYYPHEELLILPTAFGNVNRAIRSYPISMYGVDGVTLWYHLQTVIPQEFIKLINDRRSQVDFWVNIWFVSNLLIFEYIIFTIAFKNNFTSFFDWRNLFSLPILYLIISFVAYWFAKESAVLWGNWVKAAFDVYLPELRKKLDLEEPKDKNQEKLNWENFSRGVTYRDYSLIPRKMNKEDTEISNDVDPQQLKHNIEQLIIFKTALELLKQNTIKGKENKSDDV